MDTALEQKVQKLTDIFSSYHEVQVAYLFGSQARGGAGPMSDYDFAVQFDPACKPDFFKLKLDIMGDLSDVLKTDAVDLVVLNTLDKPELAFGIIHDGKILFERGAGRVAIEPRIMSDYFDFRTALLRFGLTRA